jgi:hypothetical protein
MSLERFGGRADGALDNSRAWISMLRAVGERNACIELGPGTYRFSAPIKIGLSNSAPQAIAVTGTGPRATILEFPNVSDGLVVSMPRMNSGISVSGMTIATGQAGSGVGLRIYSPCFGTGPGAGNFGTGPPRLIDNVDFRGLDSLNAARGLGKDYWRESIRIENASFFNIRALTSYGAEDGRGIGIRLTGSGDNCPALIYNLTGANIQRQEIGLQYGDAVQGVNVGQSNFVLNKIDLLCPPTSKNLEQLTVSSSQFDTYGASIVIGCPLRNLIVNSNLFYAQGAANSVVLSGSSARHSITGNTFVNQAPGGGTSIVASGSPLLGVIAMNQFSGSTVGVALGPNSASFVVQGNAYLGTRTKVVNQGKNNKVE